MKKNNRNNWLLSSLLHSFMIWIISLTSSFLCQPKLYWSQSFQKLSHSVYPNFNSFLTIPFTSPTAHWIYSSFSFVLKILDQTNIDNFYFGSVEDIVSCRLDIKKIIYIMLLLMDYLVLSWHFCQLYQIMEDFRPLQSRILFNLPDINNFWFICLKL